MTERLYYRDPMCLEFEAEVLRRCDQGGRPAVVLDRTAFYPTSGGQPFDNGTLGPASVVEVVEEEDGTILHVVDTELAVGSIVRGRVNAERRFDHMQQHTGQHILSAAFDRLFQARTVGFHLGEEVSTLDLDRVLPPEAVTRAEEAANAVVWADRPVRISFVADEEAANLPLRKEAGRTGVLRLIEVEGYDLSACGGTHVERSGAVGVIVVPAWERFRGGMRIEFLCGGRALRAYRTLRDSVAGCIKHLSVLPSELPAAVEHVQAEAKDLRKTIKRLQERLAGYEADALAASAVPVGVEHLVVESLDGWDANGLKALALAIVTRPGFRVALFSAARPALAVVARSPDSTLDARWVLQALMARFGGKGGGKPDLAQGGGLDGPIADLLDAARVAMGAATVSG